ncbi:carbohydrate ABC transporter permease [Paenibacillus lignilyticus]|nr:carbohydrate ABC transporter permease [Paenibacillus lignilyticus]
MMNVISTRRSKQWIIHLLFLVYIAATLFPLLLVFMVSITEEKSLLIHGYSILPHQIDFSAYRYLFHDSQTIVRAYGVTILVTIAGTIGSLLMTSLFAYPLSRRDFPFRTPLTFYVFFTMLFNGGLVPWYLVYTKYLSLDNTLLALIIPNLLMSGFNILIMRTFFMNTIPPSIIESASIDGAGELRIFWQIILRLSLPVMSTIGLFCTLAYWNDWYNSLIFISDSHNYSIQYLLNKTLLDIQVLLSQTGNSGQSQLLANAPTETIRMAMAIIGIGPIILAYPFFQKYIVQGLTVGAVKG